jgi:hypothetical protein
LEARRARPALEPLARWVDDVPDCYETRVRYYGAYATRRRVWWRRGISLASGPAVVIVPREAASDWPALQARRRRWAELLRLVFRIEIEVCPTHLRWVPDGGSMTVLGFVTDQAVVRRILAHLDRRHVDPRAGPWAAFAAAPG